MRRRAAALGIVVLLTACGSDAKSSVSTSATTATVSTTSAPPTTTSTTEPATTTTTTLPTTTTECVSGSIEPRNASDTSYERWQCVAGFWQLLGTVAITTTTTLDPVIEGDLHVAIAGANLMANKDKIIEAVKSASSSVDSVDLVEFKSTSATDAVIRIAVSSGYHTLSFRDDVAWDEARAFSTLWDTDGGMRNDAGTLRTSLEVTVDSTVYAAPHDLMVRVADTNVTSTEWLNTARQHPTA